jgi:hypothetical protein
MALVQESSVPQMRPPPSLASYLQNMGNQVREEQKSAESFPSMAPTASGLNSPTGNATLGNSPIGAPPAVMAAAQREVQKFKAMQERRAQLTQELQNLDMQLTKTQGALEVFQAMGILRQG